MPGCLIEKRADFMMPPSANTILTSVAGQTYEEENTDLLTGYRAFPATPECRQHFFTLKVEYKHTPSANNYNYDERYLLPANRAPRRIVLVRVGHLPLCFCGMAADKESFSSPSTETLSTCSRYVPAMASSVTKTLVNTCIRP